MDFSTIHRCNMFRAQIPPTLDHVRAMSSVSGPSAGVPESPVSPSVEGLEMQVRDFLGELTHLEINERRPINKQNIDVAMENHDLTREILAQIVSDLKAQLNETPLGDTLEAVIKILKLDIK